MLSMNPSLIIGVTAKFGPSAIKDFSSRDNSVLIVVTRSEAESSGCVLIMSEQIVSEVGGKD